MQIVRSLISVRFWIIATLALGLAGSAPAAPTDPVTVTLPPDGGPAFVPGARLVEDLPQNYVEEEFFVSGGADLFNYAHNPPLGPTDLDLIQEDVPYTTRLIVRRPADHYKFNGTVVIDWWNSTAGFDVAPAWDASAEYFARSGAIYVGVTNSTTSLDFLVGGCRLFDLLPPICGTRYATLSLPENGLAYDMMSQIANVLKSDSPENPLPEDYDVERIYHTGQSQQGGSMVTYASAFHFEVNDGYFVQQAASARPINFGPSCNDPESPSFPDCTPRLVGTDRLVRTDLPVPVYHAVTETDIEILFGTFGRQPDTPNFRYYEIAGGSHLIVHAGVELVPGGVLDPDPILIEDLCLNQINSTADGPIFVSYVFNAMWENLEDQVRKGRTPPVGVQMEVDGGIVQRDVYGNGLGGIRLPAMEAPLATYTPGNVADPTLPPLLQQIGNLACFLASSVTPFDEATLDSLYPQRGRYVSQVAIAAARLRAEGFLLLEDRQEIMRTAINAGMCGLGFELVLIVPPLVWIHGRRRTRSKRA